MRMSAKEREYQPPKIRQHGTVDTVTQGLDKIGSADDGVDFTDEGETLDGTVKDDP